MRHKAGLAEKYPPSKPCGCEICLAYCARPGWWTVLEAAEALEAGYGRRMMLEVSPERTLGVLSPAFKGCEGVFALKEFAKSGCTFFFENRCTLHGTSFQPLECRFCHHSRIGLGQKCHADLERDWKKPAGKELVKQWCKLAGVWELLAVYGLEKLRR
jgi:hypothetical protein